MSSVEGRERRSGILLGRKNKVLGREGEKGGRTSACERQLGAEKGGEEGEKGRHGREMCVRVGVHNKHRGKNCAKKKKTTTVSLVIHEQTHLDKSIFVFGEERGEGEGRREKGKRKRDTGKGTRDTGKGKRERKERRVRRVKGDGRERESRLKK